MRGALYSYNSITSYWYFGSAILLKSGYTCHLELDASLAIAQILLLHGVGGCVGGGGGGGRGGEGVGLAPGIVSLHCVVVDMLHRNTLPCHSPAAVFSSPSKT